MRLYGQFESQASQSVVSRGFASVFTDAHLYELERLANDLDEAAPEVPGASDKIGIFVGPLRSLDPALRAGHEQLWVMVAPNSDTVGTRVKHLLADVPNVVLLAPSPWAMQVLKKAFPKTGIMCVPHGIDPGFSRWENLPEEQDDAFRVLHMSSTIFERKGTDTLLRAWALVRESTWKLLVSAPSDKRLAFLELVKQLGAEDSVTVAGRFNYDSRNMSRLYSQADYVCQPSRGEGFGMVPLEARACGTPVIMTTCTGHQVHAGGPGVIPVHTGDLEPIDDFPGAKAPALDVNDLAAALQQAFRDKERLQAEARLHAPVLRKAWSWESQLSIFREFITHT